MTTPLDTLLLSRTDFTDQSTIGDVWIDNTWVCYALEPTSRKSAPGIHSIPQGKYELVMYESPRMKAKVTRLMVEGKPIHPIIRAARVPLLLKVPNHEFVEIHPGNSLKDTKDCILPGFGKDIDWVSNSEKAFIYIVEKVEEKLRAGKCYIGISGGA